MAEVSGLTGSGAFVPQSFAVRDRGPESRDGRQQTSQYAEQNTQQNNSVDVRKNAAASNRTVQASNAVSDLSVTRRQTEEALRKEDEPPVRLGPPEEQQRSASVDRTVVSLDQQLQRSAVDRNARVESEGNAVESARPQLSSLDAPPQRERSEAQSDAGRETRGEPAREPGSQSEGTSAQSSLQERFTRGTAEDALGLNVNTSS